MNARPRLLFVYNADTGLFNALADSAHKILSPQTYQWVLCEVTLIHTSRARPIDHACRTPPFAR